MWSSSVEARAKVFGRVKRGWREESYTWSTQKRTAPDRGSCRVDVNNKVLVGKQRAQEVALDGDISRSRGEVEGRKSSEADGTHDATRHRAETHELEILLKMATMTFRISILLGKLTSIYRLSGRD